MSSPTNTVQPSLFDTTEWETRPATLSLFYKSGTVHAFDTHVMDARRRAETAISRKSVKFIKVAIPNNESTKVRVATWDPKNKWNVQVFNLPQAKN